MIKKALHSILRKPILRLSDRFASKPDQLRVYNALSKLYENILLQKENKGIIIDAEMQVVKKYIIFSDQHKGVKDGADDFRNAEPVYLSALDYYFKENYFYINLGDSEELWENKIFNVSLKNKANFEKEKLFIDAQRYIKIFGNHDVFWRNDPLSALMLKLIFGTTFPIYEGALLKCKTEKGALDFFLTHGHQGDNMSDGNWFSAWFIANVWAPLQSYLDINSNTPSNSSDLKTKHNSMMYDWSATQKHLVLITGHTHQPVFNSLTHLERLYLRLYMAKQKGNADEIKAFENELINRKMEYPSAEIDFSKIKNSYFNTGCCCFSDGDITGIEIDTTHIRLIKWSDDGNNFKREVLEENKLENLLS